MNGEDSIKVYLVWVGDTLFIRGTTIQVAYICHKNSKWCGIVLGLEGKGIIGDKSSRCEVEKEILEKLSKASKCRQYRSNISGKFLKTGKYPNGMSGGSDFDKYELGR